MAYLNVRERKIEARIAYIGPSGAGKATNVEQLGLRATPRPITASRATNDDTGETVSIDWAAPSSTQFRDCSLTVKVVAPCGAPSAERTRAVLKDADGVVLVLDASPDAADHNRATAELVRAALTGARKNRIPVVVQVNKTDLPDALDPTVVVEGADVSWPSVGAAALHGQGVVETLERALADVLASLEEQGHDGAPSTARPVRGESARAEGNPLLAALRQVLRDTVSEHVAELEARFAGRIDRSVRDALDELGLGTELPALRRTLAEEGAQAQATLGALRDEVEAGRQATAEVAAVVGGIADATTRALSAQRSSLEAIEQRLAALEDRSSSPSDGDVVRDVGRLLELSDEALSRIGLLGAEVERTGTAAREEAAALRAHVVAEVGRSRDELESRLLASIEARSRADRDLAAASTLPLRRAIDGLSAEVKSSDTRPRVSELAAELAAVKAQLEALAGLVPVVREIDKAMKRDIRDVVVRHLVGVEEAVRVATAEAKQSAAAAEQGLDGLGTQFTELTEELKKREKKGWFG